MSYPQSSPSAPPPGINPAILGGGESAPYPSGPGHPPGGYPPRSYPQPMDTYPPAGGYPQPGAGGYPPSGGYPEPGAGGYPPSGGYPEHGAGGYPPSGGYPEHGAGGYPQSGGYPEQGGGGYPPSGGYPQSGGYPEPGIPMTHQPQPGAGYPPPGAMQPGADWMPIPTGVPVCPRGLEYLTMIDQLLVHQKVELLEVFLSFETKNKYTIKNSLGQKIYTAKEDTDCCTRNCCGNSRPFDIKIKDNAGMEVIHLSRDLRCSSCCFPCCLQKLEVYAPPGQLIGTVVQEWSIFTPVFRVENERGDAVFKIEGPCCTFSICGDVDFQVLSTNGIEVGKISKQWSGLLREAFTDSDHFGITFPIDLDVKMKATLLGALFLIDYMFFEKEGNKENDMPGML